MFKSFRTADFDIFKHELPLCQGKSIAISFCKGSGLFCASCIISGFLSGEKTTNILWVWHKKFYRICLVNCHDFIANSKAWQSSWRYAFYWVFFSFSSLSSLLTQLNMLSRCKKRCSLAAIPMSKHLHRWFSVAACMSSAAAFLFIKAG